MMGDQEEAMRAKYMVGMAGYSACLAGQVLMEEEVVVPSKEKGEAAVAVHWIAPVGRRRSSEWPRQSLVYPRLLPDSREVARSPLYASHPRRCRHRLGPLVWQVEEKKLPQPGLPF